MSSYHGPPIPSLWRALFASAAALAACAAPPEEPPRGPLPLALPELELRAYHHAGTPLSGPRPVDDPRAYGVGDALALEIELVYLERAPELGGAPVAEHAELVARTTGREPLGSASVLAREAQVASGEQGRELARLLAELPFRTGSRSAMVARLHGALTPGTTAVLEALARENVRDPDDFLGEQAGLGPVERSLAIAVARGAAPQGDDELELALSISDLPPGFWRGEHLAPEEAAGLERAPRRTPTQAPAILPRETLLLAERPRAGGGPLVVVLPSPFEGGEGEAFAAIVELREPPREGPEAERFATVLARSLAERESLGERAAAGAGELAQPQARIRRLELESAFGSLLEGTRPRGALLLLSEATGAPFAAELALVASDGELDEFRTELAASPGAASADPGDARALGWLVEAAAYRYLARLLQEGRAAARHEAVLVRQAGEVARFPGLLADLALESTGAEAFHARLVEENRLLLEDSQPAARVRAFDWLAARGLAPAGYDPLAEREARRAALEAAREPADPEAPAPEEAATGGDRR